MDKKIWSALSTLYQREITSREQLLNEMLRIKTLLNKFEEQQLSIIAEDKERLFQVMKEETEDDFGFFRADRDDFVDFFEVLRDVDPIDFTLEIYKDDRMGTVLSPSYLVDYIAERIGALQPNRVLISDAEKHLTGLKELIKRFPDIHFTFTTQLRTMNMLLNLALGQSKNVQVRFESIYTECLQGEKFNYIYSLPHFGYKPEHIGRAFLTRDSDGIATENMLRHLSDAGTLDIIIPAKITFARMGYEKLRAYIAENFNIASICILPEGTFRPATAIKTYFFTITTKSQPRVQLGTLELNDGKLGVMNEKAISTDEFLSYEDWRIELLLSEDNENIQKFKDSNLEKVKLKDVAEVFRGKSILKKDLAPGNIFILNISNIENGEINYFDMDTIDEEERKVKRYELHSGDVVLSSRGTAIKSAVFRPPDDKMVIASANLIVIRPKHKVKGEFIKIFLESPIGLAIIKSFQRGTTIMNINYSDIMEMAIPLLPMADQQRLINQFSSELHLYKQAIREAESRWGKVKHDIYSELV